MCIMSEYVRRYNPNRSNDWNYGGSKWKLSRSKIDLFHECPRCFYVDNKMGTKRPQFPSFNLNIAVDELFKKEFDEHRKDGTKHPIMEAYKIDAVPFAHAELDTWRENFEGVQYKHPEHDFVLSGAVDDLWLNPAGELIIIDYKSTSKDTKITELSDSPWDQQYKRQLSVYAWLFEKNGFKVSNTGYLVYANASKAEASFNNQLVFETTLVEAELDTSWIEQTLAEIKACLESQAIPPIGSNCEYCPYREAAGKKLLALHNANKLQ